MVPIFLQSPFASLIACLPLSQSMKPTGVFMNVGRGPVGELLSRMVTSACNLCVLAVLLCARAVDEKALIRALSEKKIRGAALDVFAQEPLPDVSAPSCVSVRFLADSTTR